MGFIRSCSLPVQLVGYTGLISRAEVALKHEHWVLLYEKRARSNRPRFPGNRRIPFLFPEITHTRYQRQHLGNPSNTLFHDHTSKLVYENRSQLDRTASTISLPRSLTTLVRSRPRSLTSRRHQNILINASGASRLPYFPPPHSHSPHLLLPLRNRLLLSHSPLHFLLQPSSPPFRHSLSLMTSTRASSASNRSSPTKTDRVVIKGRVQGVWYRNWTIENATLLGLKGWVRNRKDGSVEALFSGSPDEVQEMEQRCRRGPPDAVVTGLEVFPSNDDPGTGFERKPTV